MLRNKRNYNFSNFTTFCCVVEFALSIYMPAGMSAEGIITGVLYPWYKYCVLVVTCLPATSISVKVTSPSTSGSTEIRSSVLNGLGAATSQLVLLTGGGVSRTLSASSVHSKSGIP